MVDARPTSPTLPRVEPLNEKSDLASVRPKSSIGSIRSERPASFIDENRIPTPPGLSYPPSPHKESFTTATERPKTSERPKTTERQQSAHSLSYSDEKFDEKADPTIEVAGSINGDFDEDVKVVDPADDLQEKPIGDYSYILLILTIADHAYQQRPTWTLLLV